MILLRKRAQVNQNEILNPHLKEEGGMGCERNPGAVRNGRSSITQQGDQRAGVFVGMEKQHSFC